MIIAARVFILLTTLAIDVEAARRSMEFTIGTVFPKYLFTRVTDWGHA